MKSYLLLVAVCAIAYHAASQNIGIGTSDPISRLQVSAAATDIINIENTNELNVGVTSGLLFTDGLQGANNYKYAGAIRTIGINTTEARMGLFTYASSSPGGLLERITILDNGKVGINNTNPLYSLSVTGNCYVTTYMGIGTTPSASYSLSVSGASRFYNDLRIDGVLNPNNALSIGNSVAVEGSLSVLNGYGIVRNVSSTQMKIKIVSAGFNATNLGAGATLTSGYLGFGENFASVSVFVGNLTTGTGDYGKILIVPIDIDTSLDRCRFQITNVASSAVTFTGSWQFLLVGY